MIHIYLRYNLILLFLCFFISPILPHPLSRVKHYSITDGLAQGVIMSYAQDNKGYMWFATWNGLNKFDGYTFQTFNARSGDDSELTNNRIEFINVGIHDWIWLRTYDLKGFVFKPDTQTFIDVLATIPREKSKVKRLNVLPKGVVWFICDGGYCYRIDERKYKNTPIVEQYNLIYNNLEGNIIYDIFQDSEEDEWILTNKGAKVIGKKIIHSPYPFKYFEEINKEIWLATADGILGKYDKKTGKVTIIDLLRDDTTISGLKAMDNKTLAIGTLGEGLILYNIKTHQTKQIDLRTANQSSNDIHSLYLDKHAILWMSTASAGVIHWDHKNKKLFHFPPLPSNHMEKRYNDTFFIFEDNNDQLWIHPKNGNFNLYDRENKKLDYFLNDPKDPTSILSPSVHSYFADRQGNLWINTSNRNLEKIHFFNTPFTVTNLEAEARLFFFDNNKQLWIGTRDNKIRIYDENEKLIGFLNKEGQIVKQECYFSTNPYCMLSIGDEIWMGTRDDGLYILSKDKNKANSYQIQKYKNSPSDPFSLSYNDIFSIYQDSYKNIWIGTFNKGINLVQPSKGGRLKFINNNNLLKNYPLDNFSRVRCISEMPNNTILIGTTGGLISFPSQFDDPQTIHFQTHTSNPNDEHSLSNNNVIHICNTKQNETYISTLGGGINKVITDSTRLNFIRFKSFSHPSSQSLNWALSSIEDDEGKLWIVSENMLTKFSPKTETFDSYRWNILKSDMYYSEAPPVINSKGELIMGNNKGFSNLSIKQINKSKFIPPIVLTNIKILNEDQLIPTDGLKEISLTPKQRNFTIEFAALDYDDPYNINYAYKLNKIDTDWNYVGSKRFVSYINLPNGKFDLLIKSTNSDGVWVDNEYILSINVLPKFTETIWFIILIVILFIIVIIIILYIILYIYHLHHKVDIEQQITDIKLRFFTDISHELRTPLTLILGPISELLNDDLTAKAKSHLDLVKKNTDRMLRLVNQILDFRKIQNNKMKLFIEEVDIICLIPNIMDYFLLIANKKNINFQFEADTQSLFVWIDIDKIEKVIFNLLSNAFKYTPNGKSILIKIESKETSVNISIIDEGKGISIDKLDTIFQRFETIINRDLLEPSSGIGLSVTRELVELHGGSIDVTSELGIGSSFSVALRKGKEHFLKNNLVEFILSDSNKKEDENNEQQVPTIDNRQKLHKKTSILLVEDNDSLRNFLRNVLTENYDVIEAVNGKEGLEKTLSHLPEIVVSDVKMPIMDGLDMVKAIKENKNICHTPIVLLSTKSSLDDRINGIEYGIDDYITKPFSTTYLKARIASIINIRKQLQNSYRNFLLDTNLSPNITPAEPLITPYDKVFIDQLVKLMEENMNNSELVVEDLAKEFAMGRTLFYNKVKSIVGVSPIEFINQIRIKRAVQLLDGGNQNISDVAFLTGFSDPKYFSRCFKKSIGLTPTQYKTKDNNHL